MAKIFDDTVEVDSAGEIIIDDDDTAREIDNRDRGWTDEAAEDEAKDDALRSVLTRIIAEKDSASVRMHLYRRIPNSKKLTLLTTITPDEWLEAGEWTMLQDVYGAGEYEMRVYGMRVNSKTGKPYPGLLAKAVQACDEPPPFKRKQFTANKESDIMSDAGLNDLKSLIMEQNAMMREFMLTMARQQSAPPAPASSMTDMIMALKALDDLSASRKPAEPAPPIDQFAMIERVVEMQSRLGVNSGSGNGPSETIEMLRMAREFLPLLTAGVNKLPNNAQAVSSNTIAPPSLPELVKAPALSVTDDIEQPAMDDTEDETVFIQKMIKRRLSELVTLAASNGDVETVAGDLLDIIPPAIMDQWMENKNLLAELSAICPDVANYPAWFDSLRLKMLELTTDNEPDK